MTLYENYQCTCRGGVPDYVPNYAKTATFFSPQILQDPSAGLYAMLEERGGDMSEPIIMEDCYGIPWQLHDEGPMVVSNTCLFEEAADWKGNYRIPDLTDYDWDKACTEDARWIEPGKPVILGIYGHFTQLYNAMGFMNAMIAVAEDPDSVKEMFEAMTEFLEVVIEESMKRVHVDTIIIFDDIASSSSCFISADTYRDLVKPYHRRVYEAARRANPDVILEMHCCGRCEAVLDDFMDLGVNVWQPAQPLNDLKAIRAKYGKKLVFNGAWENVKVFSDVNMSEAEVRRYVREALEEFGKDGGMIFDPQQTGSDPLTLKKLEWVEDELNKFNEELAAKR